MIIDTSAIVAILFDEPDQSTYVEAIERDRVRLVSAVTRVELTMVVEGRKGEAGRERLDRFFVLTQTEVAAVTPRQAQMACEAFRRFGRGRHSAGLNLGDCFAYALAADSGEPAVQGRRFHQDGPAGRAGVAVAPAMIVGGCGQHIVDGAHRIRPRKLYGAAGRVTTKAAPPSAAGRQAASPPWRSAI